MAAKWKRKINQLLLNSANGYSFKVEYPKHKTNKVIYFIEENLDDDKFYSNADAVKDEDVSLKDGSRFHLTSEPGFVEINFIKKENSAINYQKLINMCMGIKEELN